jgi:hypothetical protein
VTVQLNEEAIDRMFADRHGPIGKIMERKAYNVETAIKSLLLIPGSGRYYGPGVLTFRRHGKIYSNYSTGGRASGHVASAPGEPPASDTGALLGSISHKIDVERTVFARIGSDKKYALYLEHGAPGGNLLPRPFIVPGLHIGLRQA